MKIAINCTYLQPKGGGIKEYIHNLVNNLSVIDRENEYILYVFEDLYDFAKDTFKTDFRIKKVPYSGKSLINTIYRSLFQNRFWRNEEKIEKWDIFHSPFFHGPNLKRTPLILTVHDMRFFRFPETYTFLRRTFLKRAVRNSINRAAHIISISQFTKDEIIAAYNCDPDKIQVIHEAIDIERFSQSISHLKDSEIRDFKDSKFILSVGHLEPRKNYERLIEAFEILRKNSNHSNLELVIVGKKGHAYQNTLRLINQTENVYYLNFVSHELLLWLYKNASLFVFPSTYEGFGFPPLEAGVAGTPATVSNVSSMPEICADAVTYFNPYNTKEMAAEMAKIIDDTELKNSLISKVRTRLNDFSWRKNAEQTIALYKKVVAKD